MYVCSNCKSPLKFYPDENHYEPTCECGFYYPTEYVKPTIIKWTCEANYMECEHCKASHKEERTLTPCELQDLLSVTPDDEELPF